MTQVPTLFETVTGYNLIDEAVREANKGVLADILVRQEAALHQATAQRAVQEGRGDRASGPGERTGPGPCQLQGLRLFNC
jgi:hypothetical protein